MVIMPQCLPMDLQAQEKLTRKLKNIKTITRMLGNEENPGIMPLTLQELFSKIEVYSNEREYKIKLWYLEIYNENIRDLLSSTDEYLDLREDPQKGISVSNISEINVTSSGDIMHLLKKGNKNRTQEATNANETSSRSHAILQVQVEYKDKITGLETEIKVGKLSLIDLAGSERASATQNRGIRLIEGANINRSLLTLGNCINALCEASEKGTKPYIPYRDSKLTRLLKDSLGGNSRTVMIANVSPSVSTFEDTYNTLKYANRAKNIKTQVSRNVLSVQYHISNYNNVINNLKNEIVELKSQLAKSNTKNYVNEKDFKEKDNLNNNPNSNNGNNQNKYLNFEKCVQELKNHCEEEVLLKHSIIEQEEQINNLAALLSNLANISNNNPNTNTLERNERVNSETNLLEKKDLITIEDKDNIMLNNSLSQNIPTVNNKENELRTAISKLKKRWGTDNEKFKELVKKREQLMNNYYKFGIKDFYYEYLLSITKAHNSKLFLIENKFKEKFNKALSEIKENYINELENQVRLRDHILRKQGVNIYEEEDPNKIKTVEQLKNEYLNKLPIIPHKKVPSQDSIHINHPHSANNSNLPPINNTNNLNSILSEIRLINNNINKLDNITKKEKSRARDHNYVPNNKEIAREKFNQARNYSQGVRHMNVVNPGSNNNESNKYLGLNNHNSSNNVISNNMVSNQINNNISTLNQRVQLNKNHSTKQMSQNKNNKNNLAVVKTKFNKDSNSEKSFSNNISNEQEISDVIEIDNSEDDFNNNNIRVVNNKRNNHFKEHIKNSMPFSQNKEESPPNLSSPPNKKDIIQHYNKFLVNNKDINSNKRDDSSSKLAGNPSNWEFQPGQFAKKKDLNVFLNDKTKFGKKKLPFKI